MKDVLFGIAIGDAFGAGVEFHDRDWIQQNVDFTQFVYARDQIKVPSDEKENFTKNYNIWDYTDDTEMTIGLMKALMREAFTEDILIEEWEKEYERGKSIKGYGRNGHGSMAWFYNKQMTIEQIRDFQRSRINPGNAPAMRAVPLGFVPDEKINRFAEINANATHPNINAIIASQCIARAAEYMLVKNGEPKKIIDYCFTKVKLNEEYKRYLSQVDQLSDELEDHEYEILCGDQPIKKPYFLGGIKGCPSDSKYTTGCVLYILKNSQNAMEALRRSIYIGGDVDSLASITTGIMAGREGLVSLPPFMIQNVEGKEYLETIANQFEESIKAL